ncbi:hypothetical protein SUGI_0329410 [Cryptomeria japonica]|nr:hypothetical protein SUGI_0329410 [Cryptomeria japonica]
MMGIGLKSCRIYRAALFSNGMSGPGKQKEENYCLSTTDGDRILTEQPCSAGEGESALANQKEAEICKYGLYYFQ